MVLVVQCEMYRGMFAQDMGENKHQLCYLKIPLIWWKTLIQIGMLQSANKNGFVYFLNACSWSYCE